MIVLTVHYPTGRKRHLFSQDKIVASTNPQDHADLLLHNLSLPIRFTIEKEEGRYLICNNDNSPFITLNDKAFYRKELTSLDTISVDMLPISFSLEEKLTQAEEELEEEAFIENTEQEKEDLQPTIPSFFEEEIKQETEFVDDEILSDWESKNLSVVFRKKEKRREETAAAKTPEEAAVKEGPKPPQEKKVFPFLPQMSNFSEAFHPIAKARFALRIVFFIFCFIFALGSAISFGAYHHYKEESILDAKNAARSVADIALALIYAQINHIQPPMQNWSDPNFLNRGINGVISPFHVQLHHVDSRGKLLLSNYMLRIYTSKDLNRFVVIAQPEPSIKQWLFSEMSIVLDSDTMVLRKIEDLRALNRLLVIPDSLNGVNGERISEILDLGEMIPLASLADEKNANGFAPPEEFSLIAPQAAYYVYNAPRYSKIGEALLADASLITSTTRKDPPLLKKLEERLEHLSQLPYAVLYTTYGQEQAQEGQRALEQLFPEKTFLVGYTHYNYQKQSTISILLPSSKERELSLYEQSSEESEEEDSIEEKNNAPIASADFPQENPNTVDKNEPEEPADPVYATMKKLARQRQKIMKEKSAPLISLLKEYQNEAIPSFEEKLVQTAQTFLKNVKEQETVVKEELTDLYYSNSELSMTDFLRYLEIVGLDSLLKEEDSELTQQIEKTSEKSTEPLSLDEILADIDNAKTLKELAKAVEIASNTFALCNFSDIDQTIRSQRTIRRHVTAKLTAFLQEEKTLLPTEEFTEENQQRLEEIMKKAWIYDPTERRYYLDEFDACKKELL